MSEPMSSVEIEDVLSSIRRLVSEDLRPAARPAPEAATPPALSSAAQMAASKLILTPALRVVADDGRAAAVETTTDSAAQPDAEPWDDGEVAAFVNVEDDAVFDNDTEWQASSAVVSLTWPSDVPARDPVAEILSEAPQAADEAPAPLQTGEARDWVEEPLPETPSPAWHDAMPEDLARPDDPVQDAAEDAALNAVWADAAEAEVLRQLAEEGVTPQAAPLSDDDRVYEENLLRDLVRDIIREELQGELGERITRNVRKLVRAEIARAMALRDFD